jgi:ribosomal protein S27E
MGTRHVRTLYDIAISGHHLRALCQGCGHTKVFDGNRLWWLYQRKGWDTAINAIAIHLRCSECGGKTIVTRMTLEEPTGPQPIGPSDREWKEHVRRTRG